MKINDKVINIELQILIDWDIYVANLKAEEMEKICENYREEFEKFADDYRKVFREYYLKEKSDEAWR